MLAGYLVNNLFVEVEIGGQRIDRQYGDWITSEINLP